MNSGKDLHAEAVGLPSTPNGLEMSRLAGEGRAAWAETSSLGETGSS